MPGTNSLRPLGSKGTRIDYRFHARTGRESHKDVSVAGAENPGPFAMLLRRHRVEAELSQEQLATRATESQRREFSRARHPAASPSNDCCPVGYGTRSDKWGSSPPGSSRPR